MIAKLLLLLLFTLNGFGILGLSNTIILLGIVCIANTAFFKRNPYRTTLFLIFIGIILSFIPAYLYRGQNFLETFKASANFFYFVVFFAILQLNPTINQTEKALVYLSIIASLIYVLQYIVLPLGIIIIPIDEQYIDGTSSDFVDRFRMMGSGIFSLTFLYGVNKYILTNKTKYLAISFINIFPLILMGFRTMLAGIALFSIFLLLKVTGGNIQKICKYVVVGVILIIIGMQIPAVQDRVDYMVEKQTDGEQTFANSDYIRWIELEYFINEYPESYLDRLLGSGHPFSESKFGRFHKNLQYSGIHYSDWGIIGFSWTIGPFTVLLMVLLSIIAARLISNKQYIYISIWLIYMIAASFTSMEFFRPGNFCITSIAMYIAYKNNRIY